MIEVKNLTKCYGERKAIESLHFKINKGEVVGFLGPNGAGKSTTMKILTGFMAPTSGQSLINGIDVFEDPIAVKKIIGYLPETPPVYGDMFVSDYLRFVAELKGVSNNKIPELVEKSLVKTQLTDVQNRLIQNLSKGFRQRVGIAQALVSDPEVLILDEPTVGLDPKQVAEIRELINELRGQHTIILSTHILSEVQAICEKAIIINKGKIVAEDTIENLSRLEKDQVQLYLQTLMTLNPYRSELESNPLIGHIDWINDNSCRILLKGGNIQIAELSQWLIEKRLGLVELTPQRQDLENVFINLTYGATEINERRQS